MNEKIRSSKLKGNNRCYFRRTKVIELSEGKSNTFEMIIFQKQIIKNWFAARQLRGKEDQVKDAICLLRTCELRDDVPRDLLGTYDAVKNILKCDGSFDLRTGEFDETKAFVVTQLACRASYVDMIVKRNYEEKFFFDTKRSGYLNGDAVSIRILRYLLDEHRELIVPNKETTLDLFGQEVDVRPDLLWIDERNSCVEAIKIRTGKSDCSKAGKARDKNLLNNLELYALFCYARHIGSLRGWDKFPDPDHNRFKGSYYFLRKEADRTTTHHFEEGFFEGSNMKHIATLTGDAKKIDDIYEPQVQEYIIGEECSGEQCEGCERYELCNFTEAPLKTKEERREKSLDDLSLSPAQEKVVQHRKGIMRCNAGAGSGKTTVVALNTAFMIAEGIDPSSILLITFSNAGAGEMKDRTRSYLKGLGINMDVDEIKIVTFNEFGQEILNEEFKNLGFTAPPRPIDATERSAIIARLLDKKTIPGLYYQDINLKIKNFKGARHVAEAAFYAIKRDRLSVYDEEKLGEALYEHRSSIHSPDAYKALLELYEDYDEELRSKNLIEFQDQEMMIFDILDIDPYFFDKMGYKHIIIDEFQDTSKNQMEIIKRLLDVSGFESLLVVGDDSQAIYGWRDADSGNIIEFEDRIGEEVIDINLVENHRSTPEILDFANAVNALNSRRVEKDLVATRASGKPVVVKGFHKVDKEYDYIVDVVKEKIAEGYAPEDIAILARTKSEVVKIAGKLTEADIESSLQAPQKMLENSRVQGILSLAKAYRDITATKDILVFMNCLEDGKVIERPVEEIEDLIDEGRSIILKMRGSVEPQKSRLFKNTAEEIAGEDDIAVNLAERLDRFHSIDQILDYIDAFIRFDGEDLKREGLYSGVVLSTAHSSKGLEWPVIINSITKYDKERMSMSEREEQRRLLFVSATRARDELYITGQIKLAGTAEEGYAVNRFVDEAATITNTPLDYFDEEGQKEREARRKARVEETAKKKKEAKMKKEMKEAV